MQDFPVLTSKLFAKYENRDLMKNDVRQKTKITGYLSFLKVLATKQVRFLHF